MLLGLGHNLVQLVKVAHHRQGLGAAGVVYAPEHRVQHRLGRLLGGPGLLGVEDEGSENDGHITRRHPALALHLAVHVAAARQKGIGMRREAERMLLAVGHAGLGQDARLADEVGRVLRAARPRVRLGHEALLARAAAHADHGRRGRGRSSTPLALALALALMSALMSVAQGCGRGVRVQVQVRVRVRVR